MGTKKRRIFKIKYTNYFEARRYIITLTELRFYKKLYEVAENSDMILLTKVSIHDLVLIKDTLYKPMALKQCGTESIDFIFASKDSCSPILCIRLDDPYIKSKKRMRTERFINELFEELDINLIRLKITEDFNEIYLENKLRNMVSKAIYKN